MRFGGAAWLYRACLRWVKILLLRGCLWSSVLPPLLTSCIPRLVTHPCCHSGVDGLAHDPIAQAWALSPAAYASAAAQAASWGAPLLLLGGGGYSSPAAACAWAGVLAALLGRQLPDDIPEHDLFDRYGPAFTLSSGSDRGALRFCWCVAAGREGGIFTVCGECLVAPIVPLSFFAAPSPHPPSSGSRTAAAASRHQRPSGRAVHLPAPGARAAGSRGADRRQRAGSRRGGKAGAAGEGACLIAACAPLYHATLQQAARAASLTEAAAH